MVYLILGEVKSSERFFALFASGKRSELFTSPNIILTYFHIKYKLLTFINYLFVDN